MFSLWIFCTVKRLVGKIVFEVPVKCPVELYSTQLFWLFRVFLLLLVAVLNFSFNNIKQDVVCEGCILRKLSLTPQCIAWAFKPYLINILLH